MRRVKADRVAVGSGPSVFVSEGVRRWGSSCRCPLFSLSFFTPCPEKKEAGVGRVRPQSEERERLLLSGLGAVHRRHRRRRHSLAAQLKSGRSMQTHTHTQTETEAGVVVAGEPTEFQTLDSRRLTGKKSLLILRSR